MLYTKVIVSNQCPGTKQLHSCVNDHWYTEFTSTRMYTFPGCFLFCWTPYAIMAFWQSFGDADSIPVALTAFPAVLAKSELIWNPIIYVATNKQFRNAFYEKIPCRRFREKLIRLANSREHDSDATNQGYADSMSRSVVSRAPSTAVFKVICEYVNLC